MCEYVKRAFLLVACMLSKTGVILQGGRITLFFLDSDNDRISSDASGSTAICDRSVRLLQCCLTVRILTACV